MSGAPGSWIVRMRRTVLTDVVCEDCTKDEARDNPFDYASDELEIDQEDYEVLSVKPND